MEHPSFYRSNEQSICIDPQLLVFGSGGGVDYPIHSDPAHANDHTIDLHDEIQQPIEYAHSSDVYQTSVSAGNPEYESFGDLPLTPSGSSLDPEAPVFVPSSQMELDNIIRMDEELCLEPLQPTESPRTPRIEVSAPNDFPSIETDHAPRVTQKSRPQSRQSSPRGRSSSITRPRARSQSRKTSPIPKAMATRLITTLENMPANRQEPYTVGDRTASLRGLHVHASFPPPVPIQPSPYSSMTAPASGPLSQGYRCNHNGCAEHTKFWDTKSERDHHERKHVPKDQRAHVCEHCGMTFHFPKDRDRHALAVHFGLRVTCPHCTKAYSRKDNLNRHIRSQHGGAHSSRSASQMSANSPTPSTPVSYVQSPVDDPGRTTPLNLSPLAAKSTNWSKHGHHRHDSVNEPSTYECSLPSESPLSAQPMFKSYSNRT